MSVGVGAVRARSCLLAICSASCGAPLMKLPPGRARPRLTAADALTQATAPAARVRTLTAEIARQRIGRRPAHSRPAARRRRARRRRRASRRSRRSAQPVFIFVATDDDATLLLPRDGRVARARPAGRGARGGRRRAARRARTCCATLTGCAIAPIGSTVARAIGDDWRIVPTVPAARRSICIATRATRAVAARGGRSPRGDALRWSWRAEYRDFQDGLPRSIRLVSADRAALRSAARAVAGRDQRPRSSRKSFAWRCRRMPSPSASRN